MQNAPLAQRFYGLPRSSTLRRAARRLFTKARKRGGLPVGFGLAQLEVEGYRSMPLGEVGQEPIDHLVVGPAGVFLVRANQWRGRFSFRRDGWFRHSRRDAGALVAGVAREATAAKGRLSGELPAPRVEGIVVVARSKMPAPVIQMGSVTYVSASDLPRYLRSRRPKLSDQQVEKVAAGVPA